MQGMEQANNLDWCINLKRQQLKYIDATFQKL